MKGRTLVVATIWGVILTTVLASISWSAWKFHEAAQARLDAIQPRIARLMGLAADRPRLEASIVQANAVLQRYVYPANRDVTQAGNDAQQRARDIFNKAGLEVISSQVLAPKATRQFDRIPVTMRLEGELTALQAALAAMTTLSPMLYVEGFNMQSSTIKSEGPVRLVVQFDFFVLRARS